MQEMIAKMQAEMAKQGNSTANAGGAEPSTANGIPAASQGTAPHV